MPAQEGIIGQYDKKAAQEEVGQQTTALQGGSL
jgi:hypothetical protein